MVFCANEDRVEKFKGILNRKDLKPQCLSYDTTFNLGEFCLSFLSFRETEFEEQPALPVFF